MAYNFISGVNPSAMCSTCSFFLCKHSSDPFIVCFHAFPRNGAVECLAPSACADLTVFWGYMVPCRGCTEPESRAPCSRHWVNASGGFLSQLLAEWASTASFPAGTVRDMQPGVKKNPRFRCWRFTDFIGGQMCKYFWRSGNFFKAFQEALEQNKGLGLDLLVP